MKHQEITAEKVNRVVINHGIYDTILADKGVISYPSILGLFYIIPSYLYNYPCSHYSEYPPTKENARHFIKSAFDKINTHSGTFSIQFDTQNSNQTIRSLTIRSFLSNSNLFTPEEENQENEFPGLKKCIHQLVGFFKKQQAIITEEESSKKVLSDLRLLPNDLLRIIEGYVVYPDPDFDYTYNYGADRVCIGDTPNPTIFFESSADETTSV